MEIFSVSILFDYQHQGALFSRVGWAGAPHAQAVVLAAEAPVRVHQWLFAACHSSSLCFLISRLHTVVLSIIIKKYVNNNNEYNN